MNVPHHSAPPPPEQSHQKVLNASWPLRNADGTEHARGIPDKGAVPAEVRIVWEIDGEEWMTGTAKRWTETHVCVYVSDPRLQVPFVWVEAGDVHRS